MRQVIIILLAIAFGAVASWLLTPYFGNTPSADDEIDPTLQARLEAQRKVDEARQQPQVTTAPPQKEVNEVQAANESEPDQFGILTRGPFTIIGTTDHPASGSIELIESPEEKLVYYKNYRGTDGTALKVYLAKDMKVSGGLNLGDAKGTAGDLVYGVPLDTNFNDYRYVLTWSETAGVLYDYAEIR